MVDDENTLDEEEPGGRQAELSPTEASAVTDQTTWAGAGGAGRDMQKLTGFHKPFWEVRTF